MLLLKISLVLSFDTNRGNTMDNEKDTCQSNPIYQALLKAYTQRNDKYIKDNMGNQRRLQIFPPSLNIFMHSIKTMEHGLDPEDVLCKTLMYMAESIDENYHKNIVDLELSTGSS